MEVNKIYEGDALTVLKTFESKIFNTIVTSPPYYGLRAYGTELVIWDGDKNCEHEFAEKIHIDKRGIAGSKLNGRNPYVEGEARISTTQGFCVKCGAWKGELGSEPSPELFIKHLVDIFREVKRTLRDDGTIWVNMGDSYWGGKGQSSQAWSTEHINRGALEKKQHQISGKGETRPTDGKHETIKPKDLIGIPWMLAFALRADGWYLRMDNIWYKKNPMPESVTDRPTKAHEYFFLLSKSSKYYYDYESILEPANYNPQKTKFPDGWDTGEGSHGSFHRDGREKGKSNSTFGNRMGQLNGVHSGKKWEPKIRGFKDKDQIDNPQHHGKDIESSYGLAGKGFEGHSGNYDKDGNLLGHDIGGVPARNKRSVWDVPTKPFKEAHFATFPEDLIVPCIKAGCPEGGLVLDPFGGANTTGVVSRKLNRNYVAIELNPKYIKIGERREYEQIGLFL